MPAYIKKNETEILRDALSKVATYTPITARSPGSVARALVEAVTTELGDMYDIMDYNIGQSLLSTATGAALDHLGILYDIRRNTVNELAEHDKRLGAFQFYLSNPASIDITIPKGTNIYTSINSYIGRQFSYSTTEDVVIPVGRTRAYASIKPNFIDQVYTAGVNTLTEHDFVAPGGTVLLCTNPKPISPNPAFEDDNNYRLRIMKAIRVASSGTVEAIRFAGLSVAGVRDVKVRQAPYGMGSFEVIVVPEQQNSQTTDILRKAEEAMSSVRPAGVRMYVKSPRRVLVSMNIQLVAPLMNSDKAQTTLPNRANIGIRRYINGLLPGSPLVYNKLLQIILDSSELVRDVVIQSFTIDGVEVMRRNYQPADDEQLVIGDIIVSLASS